MMTAVETFDAYRQRINRHDFDVLADLIASDAVFWFTDGTHVGLQAARAAFDETWRRLQEETYWLDDVSWIAEGDTVAAALYRFNWRATVAGQPALGSGRGTTVLGLREGRWRIVHEHLSRGTGE